MIIIIEVQVKARINFKIVVIFNIVLLRSQPKTLLLTHPQHFKLRNKLVGLSAITVGGSPNAAFISFFALGTLE